MNTKTKRTALKYYNRAVKAYKAHCSAHTLNQVLSTYKIMIDAGDKLIESHDVV